MRFSTTYIGIETLYRVDILLDDGSACYFIKDREPIFIEKVSDTFVISASWESEPKNNIESHEIFKLILV